MIHFSCPACGAADSAPEDCAGWTISCRQCYHPAVVPDRHGPGALAGAPRESRGLPQAHASAGQTSRS